MKASEVTAGLVCCSKIGPRWARVIVVRWDDTSKMWITRRHPGGDRDLYRSARELQPLRAAPAAAPAPAPAFVEAGAGI
jgi:hypothetical protein